MNLTLAIDDETIRKARKVADAQGTSVQELVRAFLRTVAGEGDAAAALERLEAGWRTGPGNSGGSYRGRRADGLDGRTVAGQALE
jgi:hypothetical protein